MASWRDDLRANWRGDTTPLDDTVIEAAIPVNPTVDEALARAELERITPSSVELLDLAGRFPAPQAWYDETTAKRARTGG